MFKRTLLATLLSFSLVGTAGMAMADTTNTFTLPSVAQQPGGYMFFFEKDVPPQLEVSNGSSLQIQKEVAKDGVAGLTWNYAANGTLTFNVPIKVGNDLVKPANFAAWFYQDKAQPSANKLTFSFYKDGKIQKQFTLPLTFTGWRGFTIPYRDMPGTPIDANTTYDKLVVSAPNASGSLIMDQVLMNPGYDNRHSVPDRDLTFVNPSSQTASNKQWNALYADDKLLTDKYPSWNYDVKFVEGNTADIYKRADYFFGVDNKAPVTAEQVNGLLKEFSSYNIRVLADGRISAPAMSYPTSLDIVKDSINTTPEVKAALLQTNNLRTMGKTMLKTALLLRSSNLSAADRKALSDQFLLTTRYILNQGFRYGEAYQIVHHLGYQDREFFTALFIARQLVSDNNLLEPVQKMMQWFTGTGRVFTPTITENNVDILNTQLTWMLSSILLIPDQSQRETMLAQLSTWLSNTLLYQNGVEGGFKPDFTVFHHHQHYTAYGTDALNGLAPTVYMLSHTPYAISGQARARLDGVLTNMAFYTKELHIPIALSARHPDQHYQVRPQPYKWIALSGSEDGVYDVDPTLASIYAHLANLDYFAGYAAAKEPVGVRSYPYSEMLVARGASKLDQSQGKSWLLVARGFSRYLQGNESYANNGLYSRYSNYGKLEFLPADFNARSFHHDGFNWNYFDGTTSIVLPFADLKAKLYQLPAAGLEEGLLSDQTYAGAAVLNNAGIFAQIVHGHSKYNQESFWAHKSFFYVDGHVIALGSNIDSQDHKHPVATTLVQQYMYDQNKPVQVNGQDIALDQKVTINNKDVTIKLPNGVTYFIPAGQNVEVSRQDQVSPNDNDKGETKGQFTLATINHGIAPNNASYQYSMVLESQKDQLAPAYKVLTNTNNVQIVEDTASGYQAYAFYKPVEFDNKQNYILQTSAPSMALARKVDNQLFLAVTNPDLNLYQGVEKDQVAANGKQVEVSTYSRTWSRNTSKPTTTTYTIRGLYTLSYLEPKVQLSYWNGNTRLTVTTNDAKTTRIILNPVTK